MNRPVSLYLDLLRPLAAFVVLLSHASFYNLTGGQLGFMASTGVQAVDFFFVLSGFVIAYVSANRETSPRDYFVSRAARIYSVAVPAIILTLLLDYAGQRINAATYEGPFQAFGAGLLVRSILFIGEQWNAHRFPGSDGPYWSLGFEVWYYVAFGAFVFGPRRYRWLLSGAVLVFIGPKVAVLFPLWLMGVATYHLCNRQNISKFSGWCLFAIPIALLAGYQMIPRSPFQPFIPFSFEPERLRSTMQDYFLAALFSANLIGFSAVSDSFAPWLERHAKMIRWIAGGTFSLYLVHLPIMHFLAAVSPWASNSPWTLVALLCVTPIGCYVFAEVTERRKDIWRNLILNVLNRR